MSDQTKAPAVHAAIAAVMAEIEPVAKGRKNPSQGYMFRGIADILKAVQRVMAKHGLHATLHAVENEEKEIVETSKGGKMLHVIQRQRWRIYCAADGSFVDTLSTGEAMDSGDKTMNKVNSAGLKYALIDLFLIPEDDPDADTENDSPERGNAPARQAKPENPWLAKFRTDLVAHLGERATRDDLRDWITARVGRKVIASEALTEKEAEMLLKTKDMTTEEARERIATATGKAGV